MSSVTPTPTPKCHGYILASQHPTFSSSTSRGTSPATDPYTVVPCPYEASVPACLSGECGGGDKKGGRKTGCAKGTWCKKHWCGKCRKAGPDKEGVEGVLGLSYGLVVQEVQQGSAEGQQEQEQQGEGQKHPVYERELFGAAVA